MSRPTVSVVIPAIDEAERIERAVRSAVAGGAVETIVADGGSRDDTPHKAAAAGATVIQSPTGRARQQNAGAAVARGEILLFLHADNFLAAPAIDQIASRLAAAPQRAWGAMRQRILADGVSYRLLEWGNALRVQWRGLPFGDQGIFIRRSWFEEVGGFPDQPMMEDLILSSKLRRRQWPMLVDGPLYVDARRWQERGPWRQTGRNLKLQWRYAWGTTPAELAAEYPRH